MYAEKNERARYIVPYVSVLNCKMMAFFFLIAVAVNTFSLSLALECVSMRVALVRAKIIYVCALIIRTPDAKVVKWASHTWKQQQQNH